MKSGKKTKRGDAELKRKGNAKKKAEDGKKKEGG